MKRGRIVDVRVVSTSLIEQLAMPSEAMVEDWLGAKSGSVALQQ